MAFGEKLATFLIHSISGRLLAVRRVTENRGKKTDVSTLFRTQGYTALC